MKRQSLLTLSLIGLFSAIFAAFPAWADTITKLDTINYGDSMVIEKSVAISDTLNIQTEQVEMATGLRSDGKIYVVILVLSIVLAGLFFFLISIDRRLKNREKGDN
jgi:K+-transporting ATPase A subunit